MEGNEDKQYFTTLLDHTLSSSLKVFSPAGQESAMPLFAPTMLSFNPTSGVKKVLFYISETTKDKKLYCGMFCTQPPRPDNTTSLCLLFTMKSGSTLTFSFFFLPHPTTLLELIPGLDSDGLAGTADDS